LRNALSLALKNSADAGGHNWYATRTRRWITPIYASNDQENKSKLRVGLGLCLGGPAKRSGRWWGDFEALMSTCHLHKQLNSIASLATLLRIGSINCSPLYVQCTYECPSPYPTLPYLTIRYHTIPHFTAPICFDSRHVIRRRNAGEPNLNGEFMNGALGSSWSSTL